MQHSGNASSCTPRAWACWAKRAMISRLAALSPGTDSNCTAPAVMSCTGKCSGLRGDAEAVVPGFGAADGVVNGVDVLHALVGEPVLQRFNAVLRVHRNAFLP